MSRVIGALVMASLAGVASSYSLPAQTTTLMEPRMERGSHFYSEDSFCGNVLNGSMHMRTELVFGMSRAVGPDITEGEFQSFIDDQVTPRFPDGLTVLDGNGQFKDSRGVIVQEKSKLLILLYPFARKSGRKIDEIRREYQAMFQQQSVLRVDEAMCVSF